jgi:AsmA protein
MVLNQLTAACVLDHGVLTLEPLKAELFGGSVNGRIVADLRPATPEITIKAKLEQVDANKLVSATTPLRQVLFGKFNADADMKMLAGEDIAKSLNGAIVLRLSDGKFAGVNLINEISKFAKFFGWNASQPAFTDFVKMGGTLRILNGVAQTNDLDVEMNGARLSASGTINLVAQSLDLRLGTVLNPDFSKQVGGTQIGGFMVHALADERGQLIIPSLLRGPFSKLMVTPDTEQFAKLKVKSLASPTGFKDAKQQVQGIIDLFKKKKKE